MLLLLKVDHFCYYWKHVATIVSTTVASTITSTVADAVASVNVASEQDNTVASASQDVSATAANILP